LDTLASIEKRELAISTPGHPIAEILGVTLSYIGERDLPAGTTGTNKNHAGGSAKLYVVTLPEGGVLEVQVCTAESETGLETWVGGSTGYGLPVQMRKLARSLRMNVNKVSGPGTELFIELGQARINPEAPDGNPTTKWSIGKDDVSLAVGGADVEGLFSLVGVTSYDTRQNAYGETNKRKGNLCVKFNPQNQHVPATAHFVGRVLPLFVGLKN
jgi:hypothetical protein